MRIWYGQLVSVCLFLTRNCYIWQSLIGTCCCVILWWHARRRYDAVCADVTGCRLQGAPASQEELERLMASGQHPAGDGQWDYTTTTTTTTKQTTIRTGDQYDQYNQVRVQHCVPSPLTNQPFSCSFFLCSCLSFFYVFVCVFFFQTMLLELKANQINTRRYII